MVVPRSERLTRRIPLQASGARLLMCDHRACRPEFRAILVRPNADSHGFKIGDLGNIKPTGGWSESFDLGLWTQWSHFICEVKTLASGCVLLTSRKTLGLYRDWTAREMGRDLRGLLGG